MSDGDELRRRALAEAMGDKDALLARVRATDRALAQHILTSERRRRVATPLGVLGVIGGATVAALSAAAVIATPVGWIAAAGAALVGLGGLSMASAAGRRRERAAARRQSLRLGHEGRALEVEALLARLEAVRNAVAEDYVRYERRVLAQVNPARHADNAALLAGLRARQLTHVQRLDALRDRALALRERLIATAVAARVDGRLTALEPERASYEDRLARARFSRDDASDELARLTAETEALEALEAELGDPSR